MDMTHAKHDSTNPRTWLRVGLALLVLPAMLVFVSCDSNDDDGDDPGVNQSPDAEFTWESEDLTANFDASPSEDPDGEIASYSWEFGDGDTATGQTTSHTYGAGDTYDVTLTVEDTAGATDDATQTVQVEMGETGGPGPPNYVNYDTTTTGGEQVVEFRERPGNSQGVVPSDTSNNPNVRPNYVKWTNDQAYLIDGRTFVNPDDTLEIEPGTVVKGIPNQDPTNASVLVVARGATILANGNPGSEDPSQADPIIFTTREDDVDDPNDLSDDLDGAWGGVIILGNGPKNFPGARNVEGIPSDIDRAEFGSSNPDPNYDAGVFRFASIRYGGISIGAGNEINGLTMGALGAGTTIEYVEVYNNQDDGFEWFGGNVNAKYLVSSRNGDDSFDIDQGYSGSLQFLVANQTQTRGDRTGEHDSGDSGFGADDEGDTPVATPKIFNATYFGSGGTDADGDGNPDGEGDITLKLRDNFGGEYHNSIFFDFPVDAVEIEDLAGSQIDSRNQFENENNLKIQNTTFDQFYQYDNASSNPWEAIVELTKDDDGNEINPSFRATVADYLENNNSYGDTGLERSAPGGPITTIRPSSNASGSTTASPNSFIEDVSYRGAFDPNGSGNWASWTFSAEIGVLPQ
jgi:PKD repeat protein